MSEKIHRSEKKAAKKAKAFKLDWLAIVVGVLIFAVATAVLIPMLAEKPEEVISEVVSTVVGGEDVIISQSQEPEVVEKLSASMQPIAIDESSPFYEAFLDADRINVLLLGVNQEMTDTIMVGSYDMEEQTVDIISIPRDTFYYRGAGYNYAFHKINSIYRTDGITGIASAVSSVLYGMPIHYYAVVEYDDIRKCIDVIDGVEMEIPFAMRYDDTTPGEELHIFIPSGTQTIDSSNVIEFLRFRHTNPSYAAQGYQSYTRGDIQRMEVQQEFVVKFIKKTISSGKLLDMIKVALENVDSDLTYSVAAKVATKALSGFDTENITTYSLPGTDKTMSELSFWVQNEDETKAMLEEIYNISDAE